MQDEEYWESTDYLPTRRDWALDKSADYYVHVGVWVQIMLLLVVIGVSIANIILLAKIASRLGRSKT